MSLTAPSHTSDQNPLSSIEVNAVSFEEISANEHPSLEKVRAFFSQDRFAFDLTGCRILEARRGHAVCEMELARERHCNAMGQVMGGAIFTLADFTLAIACNIGEAPTVAISNTIEFMHTVRGKKLHAVCDAERSGRRVGFYIIEVADDTGCKIARMCATCSR